MLLALPVSFYQFSNGTVSWSNVLGPRIGFRTVLWIRPDGWDLLGKVLPSSSVSSPKNWQLTTAA